MTYEITLPYTKPPLTLNQRLQHMHKARLTRILREHVTLLARQLPRMTRAEVTLHYAPPDRRRRDADNLVPTSKACVDGLVRAGVVPDDSPQYVDHRMPVIDELSATPQARAALYLVVTDLS